MDPDRPIHNLPLEPPKFTLPDIINAIPKHCFKRNLLKSLSHLASDLIIIALLAYAATYINNAETYQLPPWATYILWYLNNNLPRIIF